MATAELDIDPVKAWVVTGIAAVALLAIGVALFPHAVYDRFIWQYFWGPIVADAHGVGGGCAVLEDGAVTTYHSALDCPQTGIVAEPGYTTLSTVSYAIVLLYGIVGVWFLIDRLDLGDERSMFYGLTPFVFFGGALRVFEDVNATVFQQTDQMIISLPWVGLLIAPIIYVTVFILAIVAIGIGIVLARRDAVSQPAYPVAGIGTVFLVGTFAAIYGLALQHDIIGFYAVVPTVTLVGATVITALVWFVTQRWYPEVNEGTGAIGAVIVWGHAVDGVANVLSLDWASTIGLPQSYSPKHVVARLINDIALAVQPPAVTEAIGTAWPFLPLKVVVAVAVVWLFNDELIEESPRFSYLLLVAILAVGLGPGTRDFLRATLGI